MIKHVFPKKIQIFYKSLWLLSMKITLLNKCNVLPQYRHANVCVILLDECHSDNTHLTFTQFYNACNLIEEKLLLLKYSSE